MAWLPVMILLVFGMVSIAFMSQMPSEKPKHSIKRVIRGVNVKHPGVNLDIEAVDIKSEPEPVPEHVVNAEQVIMEPNKINKALVFTTKNRYGYVRLLAESLEWMKAYEHAHIHIFDDGSTDFNIEDLKDWFPYAQIHESDHRNPDMSTRHAFEWFENESEDDILINIDSDTMLHPNWNKFIDTHIDRSGVLSLYHSGAKYHKSVNCDDVSCEKKSTGAMGIVMSRPILVDMLHNMHNAKHKAAAFDWGFVDYFKKKGIKIIVPKNSLALHYGMYGAHGSGNHVEVANTFDFTPFPGYITKKAKAFLDNKKPDKPNEFAIIIVADSNAQNKYKDNIENVKCYADHYQYTFIVSDTDSSCKGHFFFKKHCTVRNLMDTQDFKWALVIDGDIAVVNFKRQLSEMVSDDVSVIHGIRFHNNEIMAGIYFIRNDNYGKTYIQDWVNSGYKGFNYDNGALHYHLLDKLAQGVSGKEECKQKGHYSRDLHSYDQFVKCVHEVLSRSPCERRVRIMENSETNPEWIAIDSDRPKGTWTSTSFLHHAMKVPHQLRKAPKCSRSYFEGQTDEWFVSEDEYKKNLRDFWITEKRRDTGFGFDLCEKKSMSISLVTPAIKDDISFLLELNSNIKHQLRKPDEIIVILSGTSQKDCVKIEGWTIKCFDEKLHQGEARNIGWDMASSDIVSFMDADDTMYPERLEIIHKMFNKNKNLKMLVHEFDRFKSPDFIVTSMQHHIINSNPDIDDGHMLYITMKNTEGKQLHLRTDLAHGHVSIQKNIHCPKFVSIFGEDSIFVRKCVQTIGDNKEAMAFVRHPLSHYIPRSQRKQSKIGNIVMKNGVPYVVWCFWFGTMSNTRKEAFESMKSNLGVPVVLVTIDNLSDYEVQEYPIHKSIFEDSLSGMHKSDYLRMYFMRHYGGGYADIKFYDESWSEYFDIFESTDVWVVGISESGPGDIACDKETILKKGIKSCETVRLQWQKLASNGGFIMRPRNDIVVAVQNIVEEKLNSQYDQLEKYPATSSRCCRPKNNYPFRWAELLGEQFHPIQTQYLDHIRLGLPRWQDINYI